MTSLFPRPFAGGGRGAAPVTVLLATHDGAVHLPQQLDSVARQDGVEWSLLWHDDGSRDGTAALLAEWAAGIDGRAWQARGLPAGRLGAAGSFMALLDAAGDGPGHYAFCDQDDVWLPGKLARAAAALATLPPDLPALYCTRQRLVGPGLEPRGLSPLPQRPLGLRNALVQNVATGCTVVLNAPARALLRAAAPVPAGSFHDWWSYLLVAAAGGAVLYDPEPSLLYRQHPGNLVGAEAGFLTRARRALRRGPTPFLSVFLGHLRALDASRGLLTPEAVRLVDAASELCTMPGPARRVLALRRAGLYRQGLAEDLVLRTWVAAMRPDSVTVAQASWSARPPRAAVPSDAAPGASATKVSA